MPGTGRMYVFCTTVSWLSVFVLIAKSCKLTASLNDKMTEVLGSFIVRILRRECCQRQLWTHVVTKLLSEAFMTG